MHVDHLKAALDAADTLRGLLIGERTECAELRVVVSSLKVDRANLEQRVCELRAALDRVKGVAAGILRGARVTEAQRDDARAVCAQQSAALLAAGDENTRQRDEHDSFVRAATAELRAANDTIDELTATNTRLREAMRLAESDRHGMWKAPESYTAALDDARAENTRLRAALRGEWTEPPPAEPHDCRGLCEDFHCALCGQPATQGRPCSTGPAMHADCWASLAEPAPASDNRAIRQPDCTGPTVKAGCRCTWCREHGETREQADERRATGPVDR